MINTELKQDILQSINLQLPIVYKHYWNNALALNKKLSFTLSVEIRNGVNNIIFSEIRKCINPIVTLYFDPIEFRHTNPFSLQKMLPFLTEFEKSQILTRQSSYYDNDDFIFYDVKNLLKQYIITTFPDAYRRYLKSEINDAYEEFTQSEIMTKLIPQAIDRIVQNLNYTANRTTESVRESLKIERDELIERIQELEQFLHSKVPTPKSQRELLTEQLAYMRLYADVLNTRVKALEEND